MSEPHDILLYSPTIRSCTSWCQSNRMSTYIRMYDSISYMHDINIALFEQYEYKLTLLHAKCKTATASRRPRLVHDTLCRVATVEYQILWVSILNTDTSLNHSTHVYTTHQLAAARQTWP